MNLEAKGGLLAASKGEESEELSGLTIEKIREVFNVAQSDRRENAAIFLDFIEIPPGMSERAALRDDGVFYAAIQRMLVGQGIQALRRYDDKMARQKQGKKSFFMRAFKYVAAEAGGDQVYENISSLSIDDLPYDGGSRELYVFCKDYANSIFEPAEREESTESSSPSREDAAENADTSLDWQGIAQEITGEIASLAAPDVEASKRILELAERLVRATMLAQKEQVSARSEALRARVVPLDDSETIDGIWPSSPTDDWLDHCEEIAENLEKAMRDLEAARSEWDRLNEEAKAALFAGDFKTEMALHERRVSTHEQMKSLEEVEREAGTQLLLLFARLPSKDGNPEDDPDRGPNGGGGKRKSPKVDAEPGLPVETQGASEGARITSELVEEATAAVPVAEFSTTGSDSHEDPEPYAAIEAPRDGAKADEDVAQTSLEPALPEHDGEVSGDAPVAVPDVHDAEHSTVVEPGTVDEETIDQDAPSFDADQDVAGPLAIYVNRGDLALAWHLVSALQQEGLSVPVPPAVLEAASLLPGVRRHEDMAELNGADILANAMATLETAEDKDAAELLALTALLRPALFDPYSARMQIANLPVDGVLAPYAQVIEALAGLGHDVMPTMGDIAELAGAPAEGDLSAAVEALRAWRDSATMRKTKYQPSYSLLRQELKSEGGLGTVIEKVLDGSDDARSAAANLVDRLSGDRQAQEAYLEELEEAAKRHRSKRIVGWAQTWFIERLQEACDLLRDWIEAHDAIRGDRNHRWDLLEREIGALRKALDTALSRPLPGGGLLFRAASVALASEARSLLGLLNGQGFVRGPRRRIDVLDRPLLRLPAGCQDWTHDHPSLDDERASVRRRRIEALLDPSSIAADWEAAFRQRIAEHAYLSARDLFELISSSKGEDEIKPLSQDLAEVLDYSAVMRDRVDRLRQSLMSLGFLDSVSAPSSEALGDTMSRLAAIHAALGADPEAGDVSLPALNEKRVPGVPPDFPELVAEIGAMEADRDARQQAIRTRQRQALIELMGTAASSSAQAILDRIEEMDPVTIDDAIAEIRAGREVPLNEPSGPDHFTRFFPAFVAGVDQAPVETATHRVLNDAIPKRKHVGPLDFTEHDKIGAQRAVDLIMAWNAVASSMHQPKLKGLPDLLSRFLGQIGFTNITIKEVMEPVPGRLRSAEMNCDVPRPTSWFLPPPFGSETNGRYRLLVIGAEVHIDQVLRQIGENGPDDVWICLHLGRMSEQSRRRLARDARRDARQLLVIDETLMLHIAASPGDPLEIFFSCTAPFSWVQPYSTNPGQIPPEVFFGRKEEMSRILRRSTGGCLIYGGRQLGKSALLYHVRRERHRPENGEIAIYLDIKPLGGASKPTGQIWPEFAYALKETGLFPTPGRTGAEIASSISRWLEADPKRRMTAMFDEADNFLSAEHAEGYTNLHRLKTLMETTSWRFKAVFAGLHSVRRLAQAPNSPLPHLGEPICIGPMNQTPENRAELHRLATEPLQAAGFDYADPDLATDMLSRMNYYPSLVQVFGHQIVESHGRRIPARHEGPRWILGRESLFEGAAAERIGAQIRSRFQLTLNLDPRYEVIAKSIALARFNAQGGDDAVLSKGLSVEEIEKSLHWPARLPVLSRHDLEELLSEMVDLGVLGRHSEGYGLRNAQVAQMLGSRERLEEELLHLEYAEADPAYDAAIFHGMLRPSRPNDRAPLPDRALASLFSTKHSGLRCVIGREVIVGPDLVGRIMAAAAHWPRGFSSVETCSSDVRRLGAALDRKAGGVRVIVIDGPWCPDTARRLASRPQVVKGHVLPIWCLPQAPKDDVDAQLFHAGAWTDDMLRHWLAEEGLAPAFGDARIRDELMTATGGAPARLAAIRPILGEIGSLDQAAKLARIAAWRSENKVRPEALGLDDEAVSAARIIREFEGAADRLSELEEAYGDLSHQVGRLVAADCLIHGDPDGMPTLTNLGRLLL